MVYKSERVKALSPMYLAEVKPEHEINNDERIGGAPLR